MAGTIRRRQISKTPLRPHATRLRPLPGSKVEPLLGFGRDPDLADLPRNRGVAAVRAAVGPEPRIRRLHRTLQSARKQLAYPLAENGTYWFEEACRSGKLYRARRGSKADRPADADGDAATRATDPPLATPAAVFDPDPIQVGGLLEAKRSPFSPTASARHLPSPVRPDSFRRDPSALCRDTTKLSSVFNPFLAVPPRPALASSYQTLPCLLEACT